MAKTVVLSTRTLTGWHAGAAPVEGAVKAIDITTENGYGWKAKPRDLTPPTLAALTATPAVATVGTPYTGSVYGRTVGSTLSITGAGAAGLAIDAAGAITGTPTAAGPVNVVETLAGATGSPRTSAAVITVSA